MNPIRMLATLLAVMTLAATARAEDDISLREFVRVPEFTDAEISPDGRYVALAAPSGEQTGLAILDISQYPKLQLKSAFKLSRFEHVDNIMWGNTERVLFTTAIQRGTLNRPQLTGRLYAMNADGSNRKRLYGTDFNYDFVFKYFDVIDLLPNEPDWILISSYAHDRQRPVGVRLEINSGRQDRSVGSPLDNGSLYADSNGDIRFAYGYTKENEGRIAWRPTADSDWQEIDLPFEEEMDVYGFTADDQAILVAIQRDGASGLYRLDPRTAETRELILDPRVEPSSTLNRIGISKVTIGARFEDGMPENRFIDEDDHSARVYRMLEKAFPGHDVVITSSTYKGDKAIVKVESDRQPALFYLFDIEAGRVSFLTATREWIDPEKMGERRPIRYTASDGMVIHGYLTLPPGREAKDLPMVLLPHGGPHGPRDHWRWDLDAQLLATHGYAVLQPNYRGSGGYGDAFESAGHEKWGTRMQDDMTDGVRWAIEEGIADPERLCVYGASYGGYSTLQQLVRQPDLYKCGFGFVGVYDLNLMFEEGDIPQSDYGKNYLNRVLGTDAAARTAQSPTHNVEKIKAALYIAHGKEDVRAHVEHFYQLKKALDSRDIEYESLLVENEGHGFYALDNRERLYSELLAFLDEHIGD